jgi:SAM-dependent methyltransferase
VERNGNDSLSSEHFEAMYRKSIDPWEYKTSAYEQEKYRNTLAALPQRRYQKAFEIGCSIGVLTKQLSLYCDELLAVDCSLSALQHAQKRCAGLSQVSFQQMSIPSDFPSGSFDLILLSEVGYYWSLDDLQLARERITCHLEPNGHLLLVHWTLYSKDHLVSGDMVHDIFIHISNGRLMQLFEKRVESYGQRYRIDLLKKF